MGIEKIANGIEQAKLGYMEAVCGAAERAKAEIKAANGDRSRSGSWARERILGVVKAYEAERAKMAGEAMPKLKGLYSEGLEAAADVLSKQPTAGEAAYLQAFMMKQRITESDVEQAKIALRGSAVASAAMFDRADEKGYRARAASLGISRFRTPAHAATTRIRASCPPSGWRGLRARDPTAPFRATPFRRRCA